VNVAIVVFYIVIPLMQAPDWCTRRVKYIAHEQGEANYWLHFTYDCRAMAANIPISGIPTIAPLYTGIVDIMCLSVFCGFRL